MATLSGIPIDPDECIGDSLIVINNSFAELDSRTTYLLSAVALSAIDTNTIDLERNSITNTLSANVKDQSITNKKIAFDGGPLCFRNKLINGSMVINQRTPGSTLSIPLNTSSTAKNYVIDRWSCECAPQSNAGFAELVSFQSTDAPLGFTNSLAVSVAVAQTSNSPLIDLATRASISQTLEVRDITDFKFGTTEAVPLTLSFWVKGSHIGNYTGQIKTFTPGSTNRSFVFLYSLNSTDWEHKVISVPADTDISAKVTDTHFLTGANNAGMSVEFNLGSGNNYGLALASPPPNWMAGDKITINSSSTAPATMIQLIQTPGAILKITGLQLEKGVTATPYEYKPFASEVALCQRYFEKSFPLEVRPGTVLSNDDGFEFYPLSQFVYSLNFQIEKRSTPTTASYNPNTGAIGSANIREVATANSSTKSCAVLPFPKTNKNKIAFQVNPAGISFSSYYGLLHWVADSEIY